MTRKIAIIGGGVAGLTAGIYLCRAGFDCTIYESNQFAGGNLTGWNRGEYHIDNCIHWLTGTDPRSSTHQIWLDTGALGGVKIIQPDKVFSSVLHGDKATFWCDLSRTSDELHALSPEDGAAIERFLTGVRALMPGGFHKVGYARAASSLLYFARRNLYAASADFKHPLLRHMMTDYIGGPFSALGLLIPYADIASGNGGVPEGGSRAMAKRMEERFISLGGDLRLGSKVKRVLTSRGKATGVELQNGEQMDYSFVICATDPAIVFERLLPSTYIPTWFIRTRGDNVHQCFSSIHAAFSSDADAVPFTGTEIIPIRPFRVNDTKFCRLPVREYRVQETFAPKGKTVLQTLLFTKEHLSRELIKIGDTGRGYDDVKDAIGRALAERITEAYPALSASLSVLDIWTPYTYYRYFDAPLGSYMAYAVTPQNLIDRFPMRVPGLSNVLLASQWLRSPGGLPNAAKAGKKAADFILRQRKWLF